MSTHRAKKRAAWLAVAIAVALVALSGCPRRTRRTLVPKVPTTGDAEARTRFERAHAKFERDSSEGTSEFEAIAEKYPDDPIAPYALLYAGISATRAGDYERAVESLESLNAEPDAHEGLRTRGRLYLGIALNYLGEHARALPHLRAAEKATENQDERAEWLAATAEATSRGSSPLAALEYYDDWYALARAPEKAYIVARLRTLVDGAGRAAAEQAYSAHRDRKSPAAAILGARVAADLAAAGDRGRAERVRAETESARKRLGLARQERPAGQAAGDPGLIGAVLPLTGRRGRVGDSAMRGLALAAGAFFADARAGATARGGFDLAIRDTASTSAGAAQALEALAAKGVIAVVGPVDGRSVDAVARRAAAMGVAQLSLNPRSVEREGAESQWVFHVMHSAEDRARALARYAYARGLRDFALLAPQSGYGRAVGAAFRAEVERLGGQLVVEASYERKETSFSKVVRKIRKPWQALFVPDSAARLALIAPALAVANLVSTPVDGEEPRHGRKMLLLSTAESLSPSYLRSAGRYSHGAVFAPGFYPDRSDPMIADFSERFEVAFGRLPAAIDAYAFDAAYAVGQVVRGGAETRAEVSEALASGEVVGLTGRIRFGPTGRRSDPGLLFGVTRRAEVGDGYVIRALRD